MLLMTIEATNEKYKVLGVVEGISIQRTYLSVMQNHEDLEKAIFMAKDSAKIIMIKQAKELGANAILDMRYVFANITSTGTTTATEVIVYGTAVKI